MSTEDKQEQRQPEEEQPANQAGSPESPDHGGKSGEELVITDIPAEQEDPLAVLQEELDMARDQMLRVQAEMQNLRRRAERDVENARKFALERFVSDLLPVVDNLERAVAALEPDRDTVRAACEGVELTLKSCIDVLNRFNVEQIDPVGETFNPELHQAMSAVPSQEAEPNTVLEVFQKGYTLNGRLVRPAMVVVAKAADQG